MRPRPGEEPILAIIVLAGIAAILLAPETGRLLDESLVDDSIAVLAVLVFLTGAIYGSFAYWIGGAFLYLGLRGAGSQGSYLRARHVLAFAAVPTVLGLVLVWPARLLVYGTDSFRTGGDDAGVGPLVFDLAETVFVLWSARPPALRDLGRRALAPPPRRRRARAADPGDPRSSRFRS